MPLLHRILEPAPGMKSKLVGLFVWQLDDQSRQLAQDTRGAMPDELAWQSVPGTNTIGMLLAHIAIVEASWMGRGLHGVSDLAEGVLPIGREQSGVPLPEGAGPPAFLDGMDLTYFDDLLARARAYTKQELAPLADADLDRRFRRTAGGVEREMSLGWVLYHILEHQAGHYYQIKLLRHQYGVARGAGSAGGTERAGL
jgi:hypothetical protein